MLAPKYEQLLAQTDIAITVNHAFLQQVVATAIERDDEQTAQVTNQTLQLKFASDFNMDKLRSTLRQFVRDWSEEVRFVIEMN